MSPLRTLVVLVVLVALGVLEITTGFSRIGALREDRRADLVESSRRGHLDAARRTQIFVERVRRQVAFAAGLDDSAQVLWAQDVPAPSASLFAFLAAFHDLDAMQWRDATGVSRLHLTRDADGTVHVLHAEDAARADADSDADAGADAGADAPWVAVDVRRDGASLGEVRGRMALAAFERTLYTSRALEGARDRLLPWPQPADGRVSVQNSIIVLPPAVEADGVRLRARLTGDPSLVIETFVPDASIEAAMAPLRREYGWIIASMVGFTLFVALVGAFVLKLSQRAFRLRETEHYLRWIRRVTDRYRALMEGAADMILIVEPGRGEVREANAAARQTLGLRDDGLLAETGRGPSDAGDGAALPRMDDLLAGDGRERVTAALRDVSEHGGRVSLSGLRLRTASGRVLDVDSGFALVDLGAERVVQVSLRDVTQQREMERQLQTAERLGSLGLLTAGVAHEINNPLEGIGNYLALAERPGVEDEKRARYLGEVRRGLARIRDIVQDLLSFARPSAATGRADLARVVEAALGLSTYAQTLRGVDVTRVGLDAPLVVPGDAGRLEQVVLNLVLNAARAMDGRGQLRIEARRNADDHGSWIELDVVDEGPGVPPEDLAHIFDPFFSRHAGTGLGLTVSFGIARAHGGTLSAHNRPEGGARFTLRLPADMGSTPAVPPLQESSP